jgi:hypothetical protein
MAPAPVQVAFRTRDVWHEPSSTSPYAETFSDQNMLDVNNTNAIWNSAPTGQRLEGGYGAAALAGSGADGDFAPTTNMILSTSSRPFGYQYNSVNIGQGVQVTVVGSNAAIIRSRGDFTVAAGGAIIADGMQGGSQVNSNAGFNQPGQPGGAGGPGGYNGGSGNPANVSNYPWTSDNGLGPSGGQGGQWTGQQWSTGQWPFWGTGVGTDICGSGGGGGNSSAGGNGTGSNVNADGNGGAVNTNGDPQQANFTLANSGGSGGGGGGGTDDPAPGDQQLNYSGAFGGDDGGAGGGGGGGIINITCAQNCVINGTISALGGAGGNNVTSQWGYTSGGVGGGGGSGGCILVQALNLNVSNSTLRVSGGTGGIGGYNGGWWGNPQYESYGGNGGDGYIRLESMSGTIVGETSVNFQPTATANPNCYSKGQLNINTTQGQSLFFDTRVEDPDYVDNANSGFNLNEVLNSGTIMVYVQGAEADAQGNPDPQTFWPNDNTNLNPSWVVAYDSSLPNPYTGGLNTIDRYRFMRFRVIFGNLLNVFPPGPFITDITFPFRD